MGEYKLLSRLRVSGKKEKEVAVDSHDTKKKIRKTTRSSNLWRMIKGRETLVRLKEKKDKSDTRVIRLT